MFRRTRNATNFVRRRLSTFIESDHFTAMCIFLIGVTAAFVGIWLTVITEGLFLVGLIVSAMLLGIYFMILAGVRGQL